jgi:hypothetical protein
LAVVPCLLFLALASATFFNCEQSAPYAEQRNGNYRNPGNYDWYGEDEEEPPVVVGMAIERLPDITYYPRGGTFSADGLRVAKVWSNGRAESVPADEVTLRGVPDMNWDGLYPIDVYWGVYNSYFTVYVDRETVIPEGIRIDTPPKTEYYLGEPFDTGGMVLYGVYSDRTEKSIGNGAVSVEGYDPYRRGAQTVTLRMNQWTASLPVKVKIAGSDNVTLTGETVYLAGKDFSLAASKLKAVVTRGNVKVTLTPENGGITEADIKSYNKNGKEGQKLDLLLDEKNVSLNVFLLQVEPAVWFDFGYMRHEGDPPGYGLGQGKFYTKPGAQTVLAPVRYLIGYKDDYTTANGTKYEWYVNGAKQAVTTETFAFKPAATGEYTVKVKVTGRNFITGSSVTKEASCTVVCRAEGDPALDPHTAWPTIPGRSVKALRNYSPGQFTERGNGYGWSLGGFGGYVAWAVDGHKERYFISGNAFSNWNEAGVVWVQEDNNGNGLPDEMWYELKGSDDSNSLYRDFVARRYAVTYMLFGSGSGTVNEFGQIVGKAIYWADSNGRAGYYPYGWSAVWGVVGNWVTYTGTRLRDDPTKKTSLPVTSDDFDGYVDTVYPPYFYVKNAIDAVGDPVTLTNVRFLKVQTGIFSYGGMLGEVSTEISNADGLGLMTSFPMP